MSTAAQPRQIRFVHNQGQPPSKRRRINAACLTCRKRKTRCAGERPQCSTCTKNGHECLGYTEVTDKKSDDNLNDQGKGSRNETKEKNVSDDDDEGRYGSIARREQRRRGDRELRNEPRGGERNTGSRTKRGPQRAGIETKRPAPGRRAHKDGPSERQDSADLLSHGAPHRSMSRDSTNHSPVLHYKEKTEQHRVPYFRYFGPTAIVPGYKQMVVSVRDRKRRGTSCSGAGPGSVASPGSTAPSQRQHSSATSQDAGEAAFDELPFYDVNDPAPVHPHILHLIKLFFIHLGCNYPFLKEKKFTCMVKEKRVEPILVDAVCALSARFSETSPASKEAPPLARSEYGAYYAQRAKAATVDTFPAPSVGAVQALLMMAYEGFGADQDSALWMYLGLAIRMMVDLGLQTIVGVKYQGERDPWYIRHGMRHEIDSQPSSPTEEEEGTISHEQQKEVEQGRMDTFWAVFVLDRAISSGTGRPVSFRDEDFEFSLPNPVVDPATGWPAPFPTFIRIIHLYGRVSDVLNNIHDAKDLTRDKWSKLAQMENELTKLYQNQDPRLHFNVTNFKAYLSFGQGTTFILMHFWFHALIIILHQPTLLTPFGSLSRSHQLLPNSRELSMSSAKTIADILSFAELIGPTSFIGNPFTSQPMYIAACAFLMESVANASHPASREVSPPEAGEDMSSERARKSAAKHSLLASAANQNYLRCYNSLQQLNMYWGGVRYILTALDQKSKGIWDCETFTNEEYESAKAGPRRDSLDHFPPHFDNASSPNMPPFAWSLTGTTNSPNSNLTLMYQNMQHQRPSATAIDGGMATDGPQQDISRTWPNTGGSSSVVPPSTRRRSSRTTRSQKPNQSPGHPAQGPPDVHRRASRSSIAGNPIDYHNGSDVDMLAMPPPTRQHRSSRMPQSTFQSPMQNPTGSIDASILQANQAPWASGNLMTGPGIGGGDHGTASTDDVSMQTEIYDNTSFGNGDFSFINQSIGPIGDVITFDNPIDIGNLGLPSDMMPQWLEYLPSDMLGMFDNGANMDGTGMERPDLEGGS